MCWYLFLFIFQLMLFKIDIFDGVDPLIFDI